MFNRFKNKTVFIALAVGLTMAQPTLASTINFDTSTSGSNANSNSDALSLGITFDYAVFLPTYDVDGIAIPGSDHWQTDTTATPVTLTDGTTLGGAYSHANGLDAINQTVLMHFGHAFDVSSLSLNASSYDGQSFGGLYNPRLEFLDISGNTVGSIAFSNLLLGNLNTPLQGVSDVVLAGGALYNTISFTASAVPVPGALWLFGSALAGFAGLRRRNT